MAIGSKDLTPTDLDAMDNERLAEKLRASTGSVIVSKERSS